VILRRIHGTLCTLQQHEFAFDSQQIRHTPTAFGALGPGEGLIDSRPIAEIMQRGAGHSFADQQVLGAGLLPSEAGKPLGKPAG
jgi:hypothetical protein